MFASLVSIDEAPIQTLEPVAKNGAPARAGQQGRPARPRSLEGKTLAVIDSDSPGEVESYFARALIRRFREVFNLSDVIWVQKDNRTHPPQPELWADVVKRADVGIAMYGGCGTCSSRTMRDAIEMEHAGIPAVAIAHEELRGAIETMRKISKAIDTPYVLVTRPLTPSGQWGVPATDELVDRLFASVAGLLTTDAAVAPRVA
jgi:broad specificity phosphatase PhoE